MLLYAATILVSSFLLFLVQPIIAKQILPWFGGSAAVWTTCLVFFQLALLAGYAYSDLSSRLRSKVQTTLHIGLLLLSLAWLPIIAGTGWKPTNSADPLWRILGLLTATIGLPYFMLSTTGPLLQSWFAREHADPVTARRVYRFFALSNLGSLGGLLAYPFAIEMWVRTRTQAIGWSIGYALFAALCIGSALRVRRLPDPTMGQTTEAPAAADETPPRPGDYALWFALSALASVTLLSVSNHITQNVASIPFLWVLPLTLYLLTFVLVFEGRGGRGYYVRALWLAPVLCALGVMAWGLSANRGLLRISIAVPVYCIGLFLTCMFCHGELAAGKPATRYLTRFYLMMSVGGAAGGMFVGLLAPRIFSSYLEMPLGLLACALLAFVVTRHHLGQRPRGVRAIAWTLAPLSALLATGFCGYYAWKYRELLQEETIYQSRNFYGVLRVKQTAPETQANAQRRLVHGLIMHGEQYIAPGRRDVITSYYGVSSGVGMAIARIHPQDQRVGVIGLGTGTIAAYGRKGDVFRLYELNPTVLEIAKKYFYYLPESDAQIETALGDARLVLEREPAQGFDVLAVDAFSSDAIPVHLITREALAIYLRHIKPDGAVAFHVTNRYLRLEPVVKQLADEVGYASILISDEAEDDDDLSRTDWVIVTKNRAFIEDPEVKEKSSPIKPIPGMRPWTDDFNNLFEILY